MNYGSLNNVICQSFVLEYSLGCRKRVEALLKRIDKKERFILDVGSSTGNYLLTPNERSCDFLCLDLSKPALALLKRKAEKKRKSRISFLRADAQRTPFRSDVFDDIVAGDVMEHLPHDVDFLVEMARTLKPRGILVLSVPHGKRLTAFDLRAGHIRRYTKNALITLTQTAGLAPLETVYWGFPMIRAYDELVSLILRKNGGKDFASRADVNFLRKLAKSGVFRLYLLLLPLLWRASQIDDWLKTCRKGQWLILSATKVTELRKEVG